MAEGFNTFDRIWRLLEYLRRNTDEEHRVSQKELKEDPVLGQYYRNNDTLKSDMFRIAQTLNCGEEDQMRSSKDWRIMYKAFEEKYGGEDRLDETEDEEEVCFKSKEELKREERRERSLPVRELYYRHTFSYEEVNALIEGILFSRTLSSRDANRLVEKIEGNLTSNFYRKGPKNICTIRETVLADRDLLRENLLLIQRAIDDGVQIAFLFNGYDRGKRLKPVRPKKSTVSPYYIVANGGRYYLLACTQGRKNMSIWRVDLMTELEIPGRAKDCTGLRAVDKREVDGLPQTWSEDFTLHHLNMDFGKPIPIKLRIYRGEHPEADYTFLYDWFGDTFRYERTEAEGDIVRVWCGAFSMVNWALQYADRVEVLEPKEVRDAVVEKLRKLTQRYGINV